MGMLHWQDSFSVGHPQLDAEHQVLMALINRLQGLGGEVPSAVTEALGDLVRYVEEHFRHEEALLDQAAYPGLEGHRRLHLRFRLQLASFLERCGDAPEAVLEELRTFLAAWWRHHVLEEDLRYRSYLP